MMRLATFSRMSRAAGALALLCGLLLVLPGCVLDKDQPPALIGPSETGISVQLTALPDTVNADGVSQSVVELVLRDQNGNPAPGRAVLFELLAGDGSLTPSADSTFVGPVQTGLVMATSESGTAVVIYVAGTGITTASVGVRPYSFDAAREYFSYIEIVQR
jgi:hypothetical protein